MKKKRKKDKNLEGITRLASFTGRSIRSAIDALMTFGRPNSIELLVLIDRRFSRDLPIQANYIGKKIDTIEPEKVIVEWEEISGIDRVLIRRLS